MEPAKIFARVTCGSTMLEPSVRPVAGFFRLIGMLMAPPTTGTYSQPNFGSSAGLAYGESLIPQVMVPLAKSPRPSGPTTRIGHGEVRILRIEVGQAGVDEDLREGRASSWQGLLGLCWTGNGHAGRSNCYGGRDGESATHMHLLDQ
jgi:hypothetical protein